jgi:hypothetical protein
VWSQEETREAVIAAEQADKATRLVPRVETRTERIIGRARRALTEEPSGFYPVFDSAYSGGGFTLGAGYRQFTGDRASWSVLGLYSIKSYKRVEANFASPGHARGLFEVRGRIGWRDATQVAFHGLGIDSPEDRSVAFRMQQGYGGGDVTVRPERWLVFRGGAGVEDYTLKDPTGDLTSVEDVYTATTAPGLDADPTYLHSVASAGIDTRPAADYARRGGLYEVTYHHYNDFDSVYTFGRLDARVVQHIPILRENWVFSLRGQLQSIPNDSDQVPYFLMPSLGSGNTLRAFKSWRFRDRHAVLTSGEFRWIASRLAIDMAIFYDAGTVASRLDALTLDSFVSDWGVGVRFHGPATTPLRLDVAHGREGLNIVFSGSSAF